MIIVLVNPDQQTITICENNKRIIELSWGDIDQIINCLEGKRVLYVTSAQETTGNEVIDIISEASGEIVPSNRHFSKKSGKMKIHPTRLGQLVVPSLDTNDDPLVFDGPLDFMVVKDNDVDTLIEEFPAIEIYLKNGILEIIDASQEGQIRKKFAIREEKRKQERGGGKKKQGYADRRMVQEARDRARGIYRNSDENPEIDEDNAIPVTQNDIDENQDILEDEDQAETLRQLGIKRPRIR